MMNLDQLLDAATEGPWEVRETDSGYGVWTAHPTDVSRHGLRVAWTGFGPAAEANAHLVVKVRELADALRAAEQDRDAWKSMREQTMVECRLVQERDLARAEVGFLSGVVKGLEERLQDHAAVIRDLEGELALANDTSRRQADELAEAVDAAVGDEEAITRLKDKLLRLGLPVDEEADARWAENAHEVFRSVPRKVV